MPEGGTLRLKTELQERNGTREIKVEVTDTGTGIAPEHLPHIFEPFFTTKDDGTGLGLPIVKRIIEAHEGSLEIASEKDRGTAVTITLPIDSEDMK